MYKILLILVLNISCLYSFDLNSLIKSGKEYADKGKLLILGETLKTAINRSLDTPTTEIKELTIDTNNNIKMVVKLVGEDKEFILNITHFDWSISLDKKYIVFENIKYNGNIKWIEYLLSYYFDITKGYITVKNSSSVETVLSTLKKPIKTTYDTNYKYSKEFWNKTQKNITQKWIDSDKKELTSVFRELFDKRIIEIDKLQIKDKKIYFNAKTKGSKKGLSFTVDNFSWKTDKRKNTIILNNIVLKDCEKPWILGSLKKRKNSIEFQYSKLIEDILVSIKPKKGKNNENK